MNRAGRFEALDILRGLAILGMAWSGLIPDTLPAWMYHAQGPPPNHIHNDQIFGLTWVDLVFPFFLFSMGAAIPLAITRRIERGESKKKIVLGIFVRGVLLAAYAIVGEHLRPYEWGNPNSVATNLVALLGFVLLILMFVRWPVGWPKRITNVVSISAWLLALGIIGFHRFPNGSIGLAHDRNDVILMVLANVSVSTGLLWLFTSCRPQIRIAVMTSVLFIFLTAPVPGSVGNLIWNFTPLEWEPLATWAKHPWFPILYHFEYHKYLLITLPGTLCGDAVLALSETENSSPIFPGAEHALILLLSAATIPIACIGLFARQVIETSLLLLGISAAICLIVFKSGAPGDFLRRLAFTGTAFLLLGLLAEPIGGGIRKDSPTVSYFLVTSGLAYFAVLAIHTLPRRITAGSAIPLLANTGANPILGYVTITNFVAGFFGLLGYSAWVASTSFGAQPWVVAFLDGGVKTLLVALVTAWFTRHRIFLRA